MYDLMIIGAGPAGLAASVYAARKKLDTVLVATDIGGQAVTTNGIENYLGYQFIEGAELIDKFHSQVSQFPIEQKIGYAVTRLVVIDGGFEAVVENGQRYQARVVVFAAGKKPRRLNIPGEAEFTGRGVTYCAVCDGPLFAGQRVVVLGGGNSALESAVDMVTIAEHVDLVSLTELTGDPILVDKLQLARNLDIFTSHQILRIEGSTFVERMVIQDIKTGEKKVRAVAGVLVEVGLEPNSELVKAIIRLNRLGEVPVNCSGETGIPGLYAAGDVTDVPEKQIVIAAGEGAKAALQAHRYLQRMTK